MILSHTEPFKTIQLSIYFSEKINKETISYRFLLSNLLISYSNRYPNKRALTDAFLKLYGAHVQSQVFTFGEYHITKINLTIPNPIFIGDYDFVDELFDIVEDMIFKKISFDNENFLSSKRILIKNIETKSERKFEYAKDKLFETAYKNTIHQFSLTGTKEELIKIEPNDLLNYYKNVFLNNDIRIIVNGKLDDMFISKLMRFERYENISIKYDDKVINHEKIIEKSDKFSNYQNFIFLGYSLGINRYHPRYMDVQLISKLLAQYPNSYLFKTFRETLHLAYDVESFYEYDKGDFYIYALVDRNNQNAADILIDLVNNFILDGITEEMVREVKTFFKTEYSSMLDDPQSYNPRLFIHSILDIKMDTLDELLDKVTVETMNDALKYFKLFLKYELKGK